MAQPSATLSVPALRRRLWQFPEAWVWAIAIGSWMILVLPALMPVHGHHHGHHGALPLTDFLWHWLPMTLAMMAPLQAGQLRLIAHRSLWRRRHLARAIYLTSFTIPWVAFGPIVWAGSANLPLPPAIWLVLAAVWQVTPAKRWALRACHRTRPLAPTGWPANRDCLLSGLTASMACLTSCWVIMAACGALPQSLFLMLCLTVFMVVERLAHRPRLTSSALALLGLAAATAVLGATKYL